MDVIESNSVKEVSDQFILYAMKRAKKVEFEPQFSLEDLVGKTLESVRKVKNPKQYNPEVESPNPEYFTALIFSDRTFLVDERWGDGECAHHDSYYFNGRETLYSDKLFWAD